MQISRASRRALWGLSRPLMVTLLLIASFANVGRAAGYADRPVIKPIIACSELVKTDLSNAADTRGMVHS